MNTKALLTTLAILGSSSAAMAAPSFTVQAGVSASAQVDARDHRTPEPPAHPIYPPAPVRPAPPQPRTVLLTPTSANAHREVVELGARSGRFETLHLKATRGSSFIQSVKVQFANGSSQVVALKQTLDRAHPTIDIDLDGHGRQIKTVVVYGETNGRGQYQILAT